jgi:hypothetical protein
MSTGSNFEVRRLPTTETTLSLCANPAAIISVLPLALVAARNGSLACPVLGYCSGIPDAMQLVSYHLEYLFTRHLIPSHRGQLRKTSKRDIELPCFWSIGMPSPETSCYAVLYYASLRNHGRASGFVEASSGSHSAEVFGPVWDRVESRTGCK